MSGIYLINLETGGNQAYIFATNKLRNVVGASELLYRVGTSYVARALAEAMEEQVDKTSFSSVMGYLDKFKSPIEENPNQKFEVVIATSGKALLLARGEETAKAFIRAWSQIVVTEAPGVDAVAVFSKTPVNIGLPLTSADDKSYMKVYQETERLMSSQRMKEGSPLVRFQRLPIVAECAFSGLPAVAVEREGDKEVLVSAASLAQRKAARDPMTMARMGALFPGDLPGEGEKNHLSDKGEEKFLKGLSALEREDVDWLAVVHADGNGLGQLFIKFDEWVRGLDGEEANGRNYIDRYRAFSSALDRISQEAFNFTVAALWQMGAPDIVPIVVGGDDLTVVMDGRESIEFTRRFMDWFCKRTENDDNKDIKPILKCAGMERLGMCAGISIAKPHFPFSQSYDLAEGLMSNAKQVKKQYGTDSIALDFHILYDSVSVSIADIRRRLEIKEGGLTRILTAKPYIVHKGVRYGQANTNANPNEEWEKVHDYNQFVAAREAIKKLPSSQAHAVREALFGELADTQQSEWELLLETYSRDPYEEEEKNFKKAWGKVAPNNKNRLYIHVGADPDPKKKLGEREYTYFLDALEAMKFEADAKGGEKS